MSRNSIWNERYDREGAIWGTGISATAKVVLDRIRPNSDLIEIGFGYGRDLMHFGSLGHRVFGVELSLSGFRDTIQSELYNENSQNIDVMIGRFDRALIASDAFDVLYSHRTLHLIPDEEICGCIEQAHRIIRPDGFICLSARDERDFNPDKMLRINQNTARYRDDAEHVISFWSKVRFEKEFSEYFEIIEVIAGEEMESKKRGGTAYFSILVARPR